MKKRLDKFFILFAFIVIGLLITLNYDFVRTSRVFQLDSKGYKNASDERNSLYVEIERLQEDNRNISNKIYSYRQGNSNLKENIVEDMKSQLIDYGQINGNSSVKGAGIILKVTDGAYNNSYNTSYEINRRILHDIDAALIINELRNAGAEAIAINDFRVWGNTAVECNWAFIGFNDDHQSMEYQPFYFYAIGDPDQMEVALFAEGSHINKLVIRDLNVEFEKKEEIVIEGSQSIRNPSHMKRKD